MTQSFDVDVSARPFDKERFEQALRRAIDARWRVSDLAIEVEVVGTPRRIKEDAVTVQLVQVAVKVRTEKRRPETPPTEATGEDVEGLFAGFEADRASSCAALEVDVHKVHSPESRCGHFGDAAIRAAFDAVRITFVGPAGDRSKLERAALRIPDLRLRPEVLYNFLMLRAVLHGDERPPAIEKVVARLRKHDVRTELQARAHYVESDELERAVAPSDVASVRACAQPEARLEEDDGDDDTVDGAGEAGWAGGPAPHMEHVGVIEYAEQGMDAVIAGVDKAIPRNCGWKLRLAPCTEAQRAQLRVLCQDAGRVAFYGLRYDEVRDCLDAHLVLCKPRRADWLKACVTGSQRADWTPVVVSIEERCKLLGCYSEGKDRGRGGDVGLERGADSAYGSDGEDSDDSVLLYHSSSASDGAERGTVSGTDHGGGGASDSSMPLSHSSSTRGVDRSARGATGPPLKIERRARPHDDYACAAKALYEAWWPHFILERGLMRDEALRPGKVHRRTPAREQRHNHAWGHLGSRRVAGSTESHRAVRNHTEPCGRRNMRDAQLRLSRFGISSYTLTTVSRTTCRCSSTWPT